MATIELRKPTEGEKRKIEDAAERGQLQTLQELTSSGVDVTIIVNSDNETALHLAAWGGHYNVVTFLCGQGAGVDDVNIDQMTPLHWAAQQGHTDCVASLIKKGANVNMKDEDGYTPLQLAVSDGHHKTVEYFIKEAKMDITQFDMETQQRINELVKKAEEEIIQEDNPPALQQDKPQEVSPQQHPISGEYAAMATEDVKLQEKPTHKMLSRIRGYLTANWRVIGYELLQPEDVKSIESTTASNDDKCLDMLIKWLESDPSASYSALIYALNEHELFSAAEQIKKKVLK